MKAPSADIRAEAAAWLARLHAEDRSPGDAAGFRAWLAASPHHAAAFEAVDRMWSDVGGLTDLRAARVAKPRSLLSRRLVMASAGGLALVAGSAAFLKGASARVYETDVGEQKHVALDDGSQLFLDAQTRVSVAFSNTQRKADLAYGRANFRVAPDLNRPFVVEAAQRQIVATHCNFDVRCEDGRVQIVLIHGEARVKPATAGNGGETLTSGERLVATLDAERRDRPNMVRQLAWQTGYTSFENQNLAAAAAEMNRYSTARIAVDPAVADLKVSGVYRVGDNGAFARALAKLLPVEVRQNGDTYLLTAGDRE